MSTNVNIIGTRQIQVVKTGQIETQTVVFDAFQTPTSATCKIVSSQDPIQAFKDFVLSKSVDVEEDVFAESDIFCEGAPVGKRTVNSGKEHIARLDTFLAKCEEEGFGVEVFAE